jgi:hypothetical protein
MSEPNIAEMLRMWAAVTELDVQLGGSLSGTRKGAVGAARAYRDWARILEDGGSVEDLPPLGRQTVAVIQEWREDVAAE